MKTLTNSEFIRKARIAHPDENYDYTKVDYKNNRTPVCIIDHDINPMTGKEYGEFWQTPSEHLRGNGNPIKQKEKTHSTKKMTQEEFIKRAKEAHPDENLDYSKAHYVNAREKVCIIDHDFNPETGKEYGEYWQSPAKHLKGQKHPDKKKTQKLTKATFIKKSNIAHPGENLDYSKVVYVNNTTPVCIIDHDINPKTGKEYGEYWQMPCKHMIGHGHPEKAQISRNITRTKSLSNFIMDAKAAHPGENLDYSKTKYVKSDVPICIIDHDINPRTGKEYGEYWQRPDKHLTGQGHPLKGAIKNGDSKRLTLEEVLRQFKDTHPDGNFDYSKVHYVNCDEKVEIICNNKFSDGTIHGSFWISPGNFIKHKFGCPKCAHSLKSRKEMEIHDFIKSLGLEVEIGNQSILSGRREIDLYIPSKKVGIEFDGLYWHSDSCPVPKGKTYHLDKTIECLKKGIRLIHIFEDEWTNHPEIVKDKLSYILGCSKGEKRIGARKCSIQSITIEESNAFLNCNHIQGGASATCYYGAFFEGKLVSVMLFRKTGKEGEYELNRFASDNSYIIQGIAGKMLKTFIKEYKPLSIISFADLRWTDPEKNMYLSLGFKEVEWVRPSYWYSNNEIERIHKFNFRKQKLHRKYGFPLSMTEYEMAKELGYFRIYDCGLIKYCLNFH